MITLFPVLLALGLLVGMRLTEWRSRDPLRARLAFLTGTLAGTLGALLWSAFLEGDWRVQGGGSWGVVLLGVPAVLAYLRWSLGNWEVFSYADAAAPGVAAAAALTRAGCFFAGCNFGTACDLPWSVRYPAGFPAFQQQLAQGLIAEGSAISLPVHPTQLYEALALAIAVPILLGLGKQGERSRRVGELALALSIYYALFRFFVEFIRGDSRPLPDVGLSAAQIGSLLVLFLAAGIWIYRSRFRQHPPEALALAK